MDERTENLITRRLDGEITEAESLELDKLLIRSPEARAYLDEQERLSRLARQSLETAVVARDEEKRPSLAPAAWPARVSRWQRFMRSVVAVAAVFVLAAVVATLPVGKSRSADPGTLVVDRGTGAARQVEQPMDTVPVSDGGWPGLPRAGRHQVIGVYDDETGSLYLLEMSPRTDRSTEEVRDF